MIDLNPPVPAALRQWVRLEGTETFVSETLGAATWVRNAGVYTGFSTPIGIRGPFNRTRSFIFPFDASLIPTTVLVRIRDTNYLGAILGEATVSVGPTLNQECEVIADYASTINSPNPLWLEIFCDGRTGHLQVGPPEVDYPLDTYPQARYSIDGAVNPPGATIQFTPSYPTAGAAQATNYCGFYLVGNPKKARLADPFLLALNSDSVLEKMFEFDYEFINASTTGPLLNAVWASETTVFSGWGSLVGPQDDFDASRTLIRPWDSTHPITKFRARVRLNDHLGTVLADKTVSVSTVTGVAQWVVTDFGATISAGATPLWFEFMTDGHTGHYVVQPALFNDVNRRYWINENVTAPGDSIAISGGSLNENTYVAFGRVTGKVIDLHPKPLLSKALKIAASTEVLIHLPRNLYAVEGIEFNIYWANIIRSNVGIDQLQIRATCGKGKPYARFYRYTPALGDVGSTTFALNIYYGGALIASKSCTLITKAKSVGGGATRKVLPIGDSLTIDGRALAEMKRLDASYDSNLALTFVGTKNATNTTDSLGASQGTIKCEAISGWSINLFYTDPTSPFVFAGVFNFATYLSTNSITLGTGDWIWIHLGVNDTLPFTDDPNLNAKVAQMITQLDAMIAQMRAAASGVRIGLMLTIPAADQDTFGEIYGAAQTSWGFHYNRSKWVEAMLTHYDTSEQQALGIQVFAYNAILDTDYNCDVMTGGVVNGTPVLIAQNKFRPELTFSPSWNGVHPSNLGYAQLGEGAWANIKAQES